MPLAEWQAKGVCVCARRWHGWLVAPTSIPLVRPGPPRYWTLACSRVTTIFSTLCIPFTNVVFVFALVGNDPNTTASVLPSDEQIIAWGQELLGL